MNVAFPSSVSRDLLLPLVDEALDGLVRRLLQERAGRDMAPHPFLLLTGPTGAGKSAFGAALAQRLKIAGFLSNGHSLEVAAHDLVSNYIGLTERKTLETCQRALDRLLIVDDPYMLSSTFGKEALETMRSFAARHTGRIFIVLESPTWRLEALAKTLPELLQPSQPRFDLPAPRTSELLSVFAHMMGKSGFILSQGVLPMIEAWVERTKSNRYWSNFRDMQILNNRLASIRAAHGNEDTMTAEMEHRDVVDAIAGMTAHHSALQKDNTI